MHHDFERLFRRLREARSRYELLRSHGGSLTDRADALADLHALRAEMGLLRRDLL